MVEAIRAAALALRDAVDPSQRDALCLPFDESERRTWFYWPADRRGLLLDGLDGSRRQNVHDLLTALVSTATLAKITTIMGLEVVLADLESHGASTRRGRHGLLPRDPSAYATTLFGDPEGDDPWGVRFEGHHVSLHATVVDGALAPTPLFLGANPAIVHDHERVVLRPLGDEEDVARSLLRSLPAGLRKQAIIDDVAPGDIVTTNAPSVDEQLEGGVALADLDGDSEANDLAAALVAMHVERSRVPFAKPALADMRFAWAGDTEPGRPHYYRLCAPRFLVEYDNTQNDANHAHSVWRDPEGDFGADLLRGHHAAQH